MMSKALQAAIKEFPYEGGMKGLICETYRSIFVMGYEQAEKDLKSELLEWAKGFEDIKVFVTTLIDKLESL